MEEGRSRKELYLCLTQEGLAVENEPELRLGSDGAVSERGDG